MKKSRDIYLNAEAKLAASNNFEHWFRDDNKSMIAVTMFSVAGVISSIVFLVLALKYCKMNAIIGSMAWMASITDPKTDASIIEDTPKPGENGPNVKTMTYILGGQIIVIGTLAILAYIIRRSHRKCCKTGRWAPISHKPADRKATCDIKMEFSDGYKIGTLDVCNVACHAANIAFTKSSHKIKVEKYIENSLYDTIRVEWFSLSLKLHPVSEIVSLPTNVIVPMNKRHRIREILKKKHYIRVFCSTGGMIYATSGPSLKERAKFDSDRSPKGDDTPAPAGEMACNHVTINKDVIIPQKLNKVIITPNAKITSNADHFMIISTPALSRQKPLSLSRQKPLSDRGSLKTFHKKEQEIYQHPLQLPMRTDLELV
jgi:hypothetical protein